MKNSIIVGISSIIHDDCMYSMWSGSREMIGQRFGEFVLTRNKVKHGAVGVASAIKH